MFNSAKRKAVYADYNASAPLRPEAKDAMLRAMEAGGNASSVHAVGRNARAIIENARDQVAASIGACRDDLIFVSGATEAVPSIFNSLGITFGERLGLIVSGIEHPVVRQQNLAFQTLAVGPEGVADLEDLDRLLEEVCTAGLAPCLALMLANNETGAIQPVAEATEKVRAAGGLVICDAVQALGKIPVSVVDLDVDFLFVSAHKLGGPQGVGALYVKPGVEFKALLCGGGQERMRRSGTENLVGIAGFGAAAEAVIASLGDQTRLRRGRDHLEARLKSQADVTIFSEMAPRLAQTSCFALSGFGSETQVMALDLAGVAASSGSACSSGKVRRSEVLVAMGASDDAASSAIRLSFGWATTEDDFDRVADAWLAAARRAGQISRENKENA